VVPQGGFIIRIKISNSIIASKKGGQGSGRQFDPPPTAWDAINRVPTDVLLDGGCIFARGATISVEGKATIVLLCRYLSCALDVSM
jgi:hypothetical protein